MDVLRLRLSVQYVDELTAVTHSQSKTEFPVTLGMYCKECDEVFAVEFKQKDYWRTKDARTVLSSIA